MIFLPLIYVICCVSVCFACKSKKNSTRKHTSLRMFSQEKTPRNQSKEKDKLVSAWHSASTPVKAGTPSKAGTPARASTPLTPGTPVKPEKTAIVPERTAIDGKKNDEERIREKVLQVAMKPPTTRNPLKAASNNNLDLKTAPVVSQVGISPVSPGQPGPSAPPDEKSGDKNGKRDGKTDEKKPDSEPDYVASADDDTLRNVKSITS